MSAAVEAAIESIPSAGFSLLDYSIDADFPGSEICVSCGENAGTKPEKHGTECKHPFIPAAAERNKICRQAYAKYEEDFIERKDPHGRHYYWLTGEFVNFDKGKDTDVWALAHNYVSVVPVQFDLTHYGLKSKLKNWEK
jgi:5'-nucleotidase